MLNILNITSTQHHQLTELISGTPNDDFLLNTSKTLFRLHRVLLDFYKYILSCAIKFVTYLFGHPRGTCVFSKLLGLQNQFPKKFRCNLSFYECKNFSNSYLNHIFESEDFRSPFFFYEKQHYLGSEMWKTKLQKIVGNLPDKFRKFYINGTVFQKFVAVLRRREAIETSSQYLLLRTDILQKTVVGHVGAPVIWP